MKKYTIILGIFLYSFLSYGQSFFDDFKVDFQKSIESNFSENDLNKIFRKYYTFITSHSDVSQLKANIKGESIKPYPLSDFKEDTLYINNINKLFESENKNKRILSYVVIAATNDKSFEKQLLKKIKIETDKGCLIWSGMALLYLQTNHTTELFDFLVKNENFGDAHMVPLFITLNKDSLRKTAYKRINNKNIKAKILAVQILAYTDLNSKTNKVIKTAIKEWDYNLKGYAIYSAKFLKLGNLLTVLKPLLDSSQTRSIALEALANSSSYEDRNYILKLVENQDTISDEVLDCMFNSTNIEMIRHWLNYIYSQPIPKDYVAFSFKQPLLKSDTLLEDLQVSIQKVKSISLKTELLRALNGRSDDNSVKILLEAMRDSNSRVRSWAGRSIINSQSELINQELPKLLADTLYRSNALTNLIIKNKIDTLQDFYEKQYESDSKLKREALKYLSNFPKEKHTDLFRKILQENKSNFFIKQDAALGLANLNDTNSVNLICKVCRYETDKVSDFNGRVFILALSKLKTKESKEFIETYKQSDEKLIRELVSEILNKW